VTEPDETKEPATMNNLALVDIPFATKRVDNVIGLFPGIATGFNQRKSALSLTVSAARFELESFETRLANLGIRLVVSDETLAEIAKLGFDAKYGARPLQKTIELKIEYPISKAVLKGKFVSKDTIKVVLRDGEIYFEK
jgi:ATP-dependent protease Clp ATPase subunit